MQTSLPSTPSCASFVPGMVERARSASMLSSPVSRAYSAPSRSSLGATPFYTSANVHWERLFFLEPNSVEALRCFMLAISLDQYTCTLESADVNLAVMSFLSREDLQVLPCLC